MGTLIDFSTSQRLWMLLTVSYSKCKRATVNTSCGTRFGTWLFWCLNCKWYFWTATWFYNAERLTYAIRLMRAVVRNSRTEHLQPSLGWHAFLVTETGEPSCQDRRAPRRSRHLAQPNSCPAKRGDFGWFVNKLPACTYIYIYSINIIQMHACVYIMLL